MRLMKGYDIGHPYLQHCELFEQNNVAFYVCPGTSSWATFAGRTKNVMQNCREAGDCVSEKKLGIGMLLTDWGDNGHLQPEFVSYIGVVCAAEHSWSAGREKKRTIENKVNEKNNQHEKEVGNTQKMAQANIGNGKTMEEKEKKKTNGNVRLPTTTTTVATSSSPLLQRVEEGSTTATTATLSTSTTASNVMEETVWLDEDWNDVRTVLGFSRRSLKNPCSLTCGLCCVSCCE